MGLFDSVYVPCPHCSRKVEFQSKEWNCNLDVYGLDDAPVAILYDILNEPIFCRGCQNWFALIDPAHPPGPRPKPTITVAKVKSPEEVTDVGNGDRWWPFDRRFTYADLAEPTDALAYREAKGG